jgi:hypothetical protein
VCISIRSLRLSVPVWWCIGDINDPKCGAHKPILGASSSTGRYSTKQKRALDLSDVLMDDNE